MPDDSFIPAISYGIGCIHLPWLYIMDHSFWQRGISPSPLLYILYIRSKENGINIPCTFTTWLFGYGNLSKIKVTQPPSSGANPDFWGAWVQKYDNLTYHQIKSYLFSWKNAIFLKWWRFCNLYVANLNCFKALFRERDVSKWQPLVRSVSACRRVTLKVAIVQTQKGISTFIYI